MSSKEWKPQLECADHRGAAESLLSADTHTAPPTQDPRVSNTRPMGHIGALVGFFRPVRGFHDAKGKVQLFPERNCRSERVHLMSLNRFCSPNKLHGVAEQVVQPLTAPASKHSDKVWETQLMQTEGQTRLVKRQREATVVAQVAGSSPGTLEVWLQVQRPPLRFQAQLVEKLPPPPGAPSPGPRVCL